VSEPAADLRWWKKDGDDVATTVHDAVRRIRANQEYRQSDDLLHASLFGDVQMLGFGAYTYARPTSTKGAQLSLNVVRNMVQAVVARIAAKAKPKPTFMTRAGDWELRRKARKLEKAVDGTFYQAGFYERAKLVFRDAAIFGTGVMKWGVDYNGKRVYCERTLPGEIVVDDSEALYGDQSARTYYHRRYYDKAVLSEIYPEHESAIMAERFADTDGRELGYDSTSDQILVTEAWRLPAFRGAKDGMWTRSIHGRLLEEPRAYTRDRPPFAAYRWEDGIAGWFGTGLAHELCGLQLEINDILDEMQELLHTIKGKWFVEEFSRVNASKLNDEGDGIVVYRGTMPVYVSPQVVPPELYQHLWNLVQKAYEIAGISQLAATSQKPGGLNSGAALRAYRDSQSERFLDRFQAWDEFILQNARLAVDSLRDLAEHCDEPVVISSRRGTAVEQIDFKENDLDDRVYELQVAATSSLPTTPAGKIAFAEDLGRMGIADPDELIELLELPDTDRFVRRRLATRQLVEDMLEEVIETGTYEPPEPYMHWPTAIKVAVESYLEYRRDKAPPERLDLVSRWIVQANLMRMKEQAEAAPPPPPGGPPGPPPGEMMPPEAGGMPPEMAA
jgi:hypothetical protein